MTVLIDIADVAQSLHHRLFRNGILLLVGEGIGVGIGRVAIGKRLAVGDSHCAIIACGIDAVCRCGAAQGDSAGAEAIPTSLCRYVAAADCDGIICFYTNAT